MLNWDTSPAAAWLAQSGSGGARIADAVLWILALMGAVVLLGLILMRLRRVLLTPEDDDGMLGLPMTELRRLRDTGELSEEEFQRAVAAMASRAKSAGERPESDDAS